MGRHILPVFFWYHLLGICKLQNFYLYDIYMNYNKKGGETSCLIIHFLIYCQIIVELAKLYGSDRDAYNLALQRMHSVDGSAYIAG